jgi:uncharacterized protein (TIGR02996 family)
MITSLADNIAALLDNPTERGLHAIVLDRFLAETPDARRAALELVLRHRDNDGPRYVYALWAELNGEPECAEFVRVQCELANAPPECDGPCDYWDKLRRRERELFPSICAELFMEGMPMQGLTSMFDSNSATVRNAAYEFRYSRGFISRITCSAEDFLEHADALAWHPEMTDECPECKGFKYGAVGKGGYPWGAKCDECRAVGRIPRPMPDTAQPIERVRLATWPNIHVTGIESSDWAVMSWSAAVEILREHLSRLYGGIEFELPLPEFDPGAHPRDASGRFLPNIGTVTFENRGTTITRIT